MKKISLFLILFTTTNLFAQETTGRVRTQDKYSKAILEINNGYLINDLTAFDKYFSENGNYNVNGKRFKKN